MGRTFRSMRCRMTLKGTLTDPLLSALAPSLVEQTGTVTILTFDLRDSSELWGVVARLNDLGLGLIAVSTHEEGPPFRHDAAGAPGAARGSTASGAS
jgi:hypothetical protein